MLSTAIPDVLESRIHIYMHIHACTQQRSRISSRQRRQRETIVCFEYDCEFVSILWVLCVALVWRCCEEGGSKSMTITMTIVVTGSQVCEDSDPTLVVARSIARSIYSSKHPIERQYLFTVVFLHISGERWDLSEHWF